MYRKIRTPEKNYVIVLKFEQCGFAIGAVWSGSVCQDLSVQIFELPHDKTNKMICAPSEDSDQPGYLIRVFAVCIKKAWVLSYPLSIQRRLWSDWADAQADLSLCWVHMPFCWFCHEAAHLGSSQYTCMRFYSQGLIISGQRDSCSVM